MVLVCYNVFGLFVRHPSWSVEGGTKVSEHPVHLVLCLKSRKDRFPSSTQVVTLSKVYLEFIEDRLTSSTLFKVYKLYLWPKALANALLCVFGREKNI